MNFILICLRLLINLNSTSESSGDCKGNLRRKHVTATVFSDVADNVVYIILLLNSQSNKCYNLIQLPECLNFRDKKLVTWNLQEHS